MQHHQASSQILTFCGGNVENGIKLDIGEQDELIAESLKHFFTFRMMSHETGHLYL